MLTNGKSRLSVNGYSLYYSCRFEISQSMKLRYKKFSVLFKKIGQEGVLRTVNLNFRIRNQV